MFIHNRLTQHVSGIIMPIVRRTDCIKLCVVLAWMCWLCGVGTRAKRTVTVRSACVATPHNCSWHIQANTTRGFIPSVLLTMGIMMPETCWVNLLWINIYPCVIRCFFLLFSVAYPSRWTHGKCLSQGETFHSVTSFMLAKSIEFVRWPWCHIVRKVFEIKREYVGGSGYMQRVWDHALREERDITLPILHWCIHGNLRKGFYTWYWASAGTGLHLDKTFIVNLNGEWNWGMASCHRPCTGLEAWCHF